MRVATTIFAAALAAISAVLPAVAAPPASAGPRAAAAPLAAVAPQATWARRPATSWVRHLNCATNEPPAGRLVTGEGSWLGRGRLVCHCLLVRHATGWLLVDTGLGTRDVADAQRRFLAPYLWLLAPRLDPAETAIGQLRRRGIDPAEVTDIALTHLDLDHAGGLADFPHARVHVLAPELGRYTDGSPVAALARVRFAHGVRWAPHTAGTDRWWGFPAARLPLAGADVRLVSLPGHTPGHAGVAVAQGGRWLLHAGDAYLHRQELLGGPVPPGITLFRVLRDEDDRARARTLGALRRLVRRAGRRVAVFSAHDAPEFEARLAPEAAFAAVRGEAGPGHPEP